MKAEEATQEKTRSVMSIEEFENLGKKLYGDDKSKWRFRCVKCGHIQTAQDFRDIGVDPNGKVYFSCIGRWKKGEGCDWSLGGLFTIHEREIMDENGKTMPVFLDEEGE